MTPCILVDGLQYYGETAKDKDTYRYKGVIGLDSVGWVGPLYNII
jgi:hypothetical protein